METIVWNSLRRAFAVTTFCLATIGAGVNSSNAQSLASTPISELRVHIITGSDDLRRGGYAVVSQVFNESYRRFCHGHGCGALHVKLPGGIPENRGSTVRIPLKRGTLLGHLQNIKIEVNRDGGFGGGIGGDNWNVNRVAVTARFVDGREQIILLAQGRPLLKRFTGTYSEQQLELYYRF